MPKKVKEKKRYVLIKPVMQARVSWAHKKSERVKCWLQIDCRIWIRPRNNTYRSSSLRWWNSRTLLFKPNWQSSSLNPSKSSSDDSLWNNSIQESLKGAFADSSTKSKGLAIVDTFLSSTDFKSLYIRVPMAQSFRKFRIQLIYHTFRITFSTDQNSS